MKLRDAEFEIEPFSITSVYDNNLEKCMFHKKTKLMVTSVNRYTAHALVSRDVCSKRQQVGIVIGVVIGCVALIGFIAVPIVYLRRQWARAEENKLRLTARMSGLDESEVRSEVGSRATPVRWR